MYGVCVSSIWLLLYLASASPLAAQNAACFHRILPFSVIDSHRHLVRLSDPSELDGKLRGKPVKILSIRPNKRPHRIVILLDTSGSMLGDLDGRKWQVARFAALRIAQANLENTSLALVLFSNKVSEQIDFSPDSSAVAKRLSAIDADPNFAKEHIHGKTAMYDAVIFALRMLGSAGFDDTIYAITDGGDNTSKNGYRDVRDSLVSRGVRFFVTLLGPGEPGLAPPEELNGPQDAAALAAASGGLVLGPLGMNRFGKASYNLSKDDFGAIATSLGDLYMVMSRNDLVEIELPQTVNKWSSWRLEFSRGDSAYHKDLLLVYPGDLAPCGADPH
ncbi:MAG: vWA domain-containing protein [Candidatus Acidiferrum sp.]